jgi:hypothetical protein
MGAGAQAIAWNMTVMTQTSTVLPPRTSPQGRTATPQTGESPSSPTSPSSISCTRPRRTHRASTAAVHKAAAATARSIRRGGLKVASLRICPHSRERSDMADVPGAAPPAVRKTPLYVLAAGLVLPNL